MINVGRIVLSRNFAQPNGFTVYRQSGDWERGRWTPGEETAIPFYGTITVANAQDLEQVPEGDRVTGMMCFFSTRPMYTTRAEGDTADDAPGTSDQIEWKGERYRISTVAPWGDFGYFKAIGVRMVSE